MERKKIRDMKGFTLVEVLICVALISVIVIAGVGYDFFVNSYRLGKETFSYVYVYGDMQRRAMLGVREIIHGRENHKGIQESQDITTPAVIGAQASQIEFVDGGNDSLSRRFYLSGDKVVYENEYGLSEDMTGLLDKDVQSLTFTKVQDDSIRIEMVLQRVAMGKTVTVQLITAVKLRNM